MKKRKKEGRPRTIKQELERNHFRVAIFGSARIKKNHPTYKQVRALARMLGERGMDIVTGGGPGIMQAANEGHKLGSKNKKTHSIGLGIKLPREQKLNSHLDIKKRFSRFSDRLDNFMLLSNAIVVAPGGVGTLLEFFYTWQLVQVNHVCNIPIILLGKQWPGLIRWLEKEPLKKGYFTKKDLNLLFLAKNCDDAMKMIDNAHREYKKGDTNYCLNYKKYKLY